MTTPSTVTDSYLVRDFGRGWTVSQQADDQPFTVAVVGNAQSLFHANWGSVIDQHDVVIRINRAAQLYEAHRGHHDTHGARTDVWCMWRYREYENARVQEPRVRCQMAWWTEAPPDPSVFNINTDWFLDRIDPHTPSTGLMTLAWLSRMPCHVSVYGFDWKATPTFTDPQRLSEQSSIHNFHKERELCMNHFRDQLGYEFH